MISMLLMLAPLAAPPADDLLGWWTFDAGDGTADASPVGGVAAFVGVDRVPGRQGWAVRFGGDDSRVDLAPSEAYGLSSDDTFTVELWLRTTRRDFCTPLMARDGGNVSFSVILGRRPGRVAWELWSWGGTKLISRTDVADGQWHRITGVHDADSGLAALLIDGRLESVMPAGRGGPRRAALRLGNNIGTHQPFTGDIDELRIARGLPEEVRLAMEQYQRFQVTDDATISAMQQAYLERMRGPRNPYATDADGWRARREAVRRHVVDSLGLSPAVAPLPLDIHWGGKLQRDGYSLRRLYWQTWPGYYAAGYLYLPDDLAAPAPAVLNPHGHWENGNRNPVVQARMIGLARRGYVALTVDSVHAYDYYSGVTPLTVMMHNNQRALDLLCAMPEVDPARIGCTGCSGGAQQTFYLQAMDDRLAAAVPVCMVCEYQRILEIGVAHCPCNHVCGIAAETDQTEMAACLAPKPALFICVTGDWTAWFPAEGYPEIRAIYDHFDAGERTGVIQHDWHHDYSQPMREQMYAFFGRWLRDTEDPAEATEAPFEPETLETLATLDQPPAGAAGLEAVYAERRASRAGEPTDAAGTRRLLRQVFREAGTDVPPGLDDEQIETVDGLTIVRGLVHSEIDIRVPVIALLPGRRAGRLPAVIIADSAGKAQLGAASMPALRRLVDSGLAVVLTDPRFVGEHAARGEVQRLNGILFGRPPAAVGSHDLVAVARWLRSREEIDAARVAVVGLGDCGPLALMAGVLDAELAAVAAPSVGATYSAGRVDPVASHLVTVGDLPRLAAACAPRPVWVAGTDDPVWRAEGLRPAAAEPAGIDDGALADWLVGALRD